MTGFDKIQIRRFAGLSSRVRSSMDSDAHRPVRFWTINGDPSSENPQRRPVLVTSWSSSRTEVGRTSEFGPVWTGPKPAADKASTFGPGYSLGQLCRSVRRCRWCSHYSPSQSTSQE